MIKFNYMTCYPIHREDWGRGVGEKGFLAFLNPYFPNVTFLYPLKTSKNRRFSDVFKGYRNVTLGEYGLNSSNMITEPLVLSDF